jgi:hypothetical protein
MTPKARHGAGAPATAGRGTDHRQGGRGHPQGRRDSRPVIRPTRRWLYWNVHVDGLEYTHDLIVEREGVFKECVAAIKMAKRLGYQVATNTTVYRETDVKEIEDRCSVLLLAGSGRPHHFPRLRLRRRQEGHGAAPGQKPRGFLPDPEDDHCEIRQDREMGPADFTIFGTPVYQEFLAGKRELTCTAWAIPTRNIRGWKAPCYLMTDGHYPTYRDAGQGGLGQIRRGQRRGPRPRCENCMVHCGYDPKPSDTWKNLAYNFSAKPAPFYEGRNVRAFNGFSIGKGHLAEAKAAINPAGSGCAAGDSSQRDELLAKIASSKKPPLDGV